MKIDNWPQAVVTVVGIVCGTSALGFLYTKGADLPTIAAFAVVVAGLFVGQAAAARKASVVEAKTDAQTVKIDTIVDQTNGLSEGQLAQVADLAAVRVIAAYRSGKLDKP